MVNRVTNFQTSYAFINQIFQQRALLDKAREEVASGVRVSNPSDDPSRASAIANFQSASLRFDRHKERIAQAIGYLETQDGILASAENILLRAREIGTQAANETLSAELRRGLATEVFQLRDTLVSLANSKFQGGYIYGGLADNTAPFGMTTYTNPSSPDDPAHQRWVATNAQGADETRSVMVSDFDTVRMITPGADVFANGISALERLGRALAGYRTTPEDLSTLPDGGGTAYAFPADYSAQTQAILKATDAVEEARSEDISRERTSVGSRLNRISLASQLLEMVKFNNETARSALQDIDVFEAASRLANLQTALQALLASGARIDDLTLLNFI